MPSVPAGTYIQYGNVKLFRVVTHDFHQQQVFDESGTDLRYQKITIRVSGFLHGHVEWSHYMQIPYVNDGSGVATAHQLVRYQLPPRQPFLMTIGAVEQGQVMVPNTATINGIPNTQVGIVVEAYPAPLVMTPPGSRNGATINLKNIDLNNGPRCLQFIVTQVANDQLFAVDATFEICKLECTEEGACPNNTYGILSNRWSTQDTIDANMRTTRTYVGTTVCASANINLQMLRWIIAPPLMPLFRREHMQFLVTPDGLTMRWTITDQEIAVSAPFPARKWQVTHTESTNGAQMGNSAISIYLEGDSAVNKQDLIEIAIWVVMLKMFGKTPATVNAADNRYIIDRIEITDHIGDVNAISASAQVRKVMDAIAGFRLAVGGRGAPGEPDNPKGALGVPIKGEDLPPPLSQVAGHVVNGVQIPGGVGSNAPYFAGTNQMYDYNRSFGGYAGQVPAVQGPAYAVGIMACYLQNPCDNIHGAFVVGSTGSNNGSMNDSTASGASSGASSGSLAGTAGDGGNGAVDYYGTIVDSLPATPDPLYSTSMFNGAYQMWQIDNIYKRRAMRCQMPISGTPATAYSDTSAYVKLAGDQCIRLLRVHGERVGDWPEFPDPTVLPDWPSPGPSGTYPIKQKYISHKLLIGTPRYTATGQKVYTATMEIIIGLSRPPTPAEQLQIGNDKWTSNGPQATTTTLTNSSWN